MEVFRKLVLLTALFGSVWAVTVAAQAATVADLTYEIFDGEVTITDCYTSARG